MRTKPASILQTESECEQRPASILQTESECEQRPSSILQTESECEQNRPLAFLIEIEIRIRTIGEEIGLKTLDFLILGGDK